MYRLSWLAFAFCMSLLSAGFASAQQIHLPPGISQGPERGGPPVVTTDDDVQQQQAKAANLQRQIEIKRDTDKMAELTQELKEYLDKNQPTMMSVDAIKKAEQIEKLAHNVKSKLKQSY